jgi:hypothetical protein
VGEFKIMANHVYFTIHVEGLEDEQFQENVTYETRTGKNYKDEEYTYRELLEIEEQPFMSNVFKEFEDGQLKDSYNWYCENVGAKWCNIDECEDSYISGYSAWRQPHELVLNLVEFFAKKYNTEVTASMTYEDEFRNFMGKQYYGTDKSEGDWYSYEGDCIETDGDKLVEQFNERFPDIDTEVEDFDWYAEVKTGGDVIYPNEVLDELADDFWSKT